MTADPDNEAQRQEQDDARVQQDEAERGVTGAGGAGSTNTPGGEEVGAEVPDDEHGTPGAPA